VRARICLVDDEESIRDSLTALFASRNRRLLTYEDPVRFHQAWVSMEMREEPAVIILDIRMPHMSGLELFERLKRDGLPAHNVVLFLSGHGDIPTAVEAVRGGALDFLEKPFFDNKLVDRVIAAVEVAETCYERHPSCRDADPLAALTPRERAIAERIVGGKRNAVIADDLGISVRTVEVHRAKLFRRLDIRSAMELALLFADTARRG
jgi:two-component system response regulator DctR